jgi:DNA-binding response OmpR family regulator
VAVLWLNSAIINLMIKSIQKQILFIGEESALLHDLQQILSLEGFRFKKIKSLDATAEDFLGTDIIFVNGTGDHNVCIQNLSIIKNHKISDDIPILVLVDNDNEEIQEILNQGITDYITPNEDISAILQRLRSVVGSNNDSIISSLDITPPEIDYSNNGVRVYVVEDDPLLSNLLSILFAKSSYPYEFNHDGENCLPAIKQFQPDIIILDIMLPRKSGFEVLAELKLDNTLKDIPVIVFSNRDGQEDRQKALNMGANSFRVKAMTDLSELITLIEKLVTGARGSS